jgi:hypothetical protein
MMTVRSASRRPVAGSVSSASSASTSAISLPRSPHPTYTMTWAAHHFAICCSSMVLPVPNPPGTATVLPRATGKTASMTRCPVSSGSTASCRSRTGRGRRIGQSTTGETSTPPTVATGSAAARCPAGASHSTGPRRPGGTSTRCSIRPGPGRVPSTVPSSTVSPSPTLGAHSSTESSWPREPPGASQTGAPDSGRSSPSNTPPSRCGPRRADRGRPIAATWSPACRPPVYS